MPTAKRDHTQLICDVGELSGLFTDGLSLESFLNEIVEMIARHMKCPVCSIYIYYEETDELVLKATKGLNPDSIGKVRMKLGEGLTGLAVKELRPICERQASSNPHFKHFSGIGEESFESFLVVPIARGQTRIGAIVVQNSQKNYFTEEDVRAFRAITSQLANTIEIAKLLMSLNKPAERQKPPIEPGVMQFIQGRSASEGFAFAPALVLTPEATIARNRQQLLKPYSLEDFWKAMEASERELKELQARVEETLSDVASLIFSAQILMLKDQVFIDKIVRLIEKGVNPPQAIIDTIQEFVDKLEKLSDSYLREKTHDVLDAGRRLLENLTGEGRASEEYEGKIVIARELLPSDALKLSSQNVKGIILLSGGVTSHLAILSKSLGIPLIIADEVMLLNVPAETPIIMDADSGNIYVNPAGEVVKNYKEREDVLRSLEKEKIRLLPETRTNDGTRIRLLANINLLGDLKAAREFQAEGIGLYRTEFPFIVRSNFPTEEEQYVIYKRLVEGMPDQEITFRTLDIGGDKVLPYFNNLKEENPFLGMRSIRFSLKFRDIFCQQIRAILRAGCEANLKIMFPMISSVDEFLEAKKVIQQCQEELKKEDLNFHPRPSIGMMIELPAVVEIIEALAQTADFFSIGTNDFIQYMLAVDRTNEKVADLYLPHHPSVLRAFKKVVDAAIAHQKEVTICGDMADSERYTEYFLGIGIRRLSLNARYLPRIQAAISQIDMIQAQEKASRLLALNRVADLNKLFDAAAAPKPTSKEPGLGAAESHEP